MTPHKRQPSRRRLCSGALLGLLLPGAAWPAAACSIDPQDQADWHLLRQRQGHFTGGTWQNELDRYGGRKHQLLQSLSDCLVASGAKRAAVLSSLGPPDESWPASDSRHTTLRARPDLSWLPALAGQHASDELWLYHWRGQHDQRVVLLRQGRVLAASWLLNHE